MQEGHVLYVYVHGYDVHVLLLRAECFLCVNLSSGKNVKHLPVRSEQKNGERNRSFFYA